VAAARPGRGGLGRAPAQEDKTGYDYVHTAIDDHTRLAYSEVHPDEKDPACAGFLHRALAWFASHGIIVRRVLTDNALVYRRGTDWGWVCSAWQLKCRFTRPGCPWTNGKAERFNRTLAQEWAGPTPAPGPATPPEPPVADAAGLGPDCTRRGQARGDGHGSPGRLVRVNGDNHARQGQYSFRHGASLQLVDDRGYPVGGQTSFGHCRSLPGPLPPGGCDRDAGR
jgi:hypothetical protein